MRRIARLTIVSLAILLTGCKPPEPSTAAAITADYKGHMGRSLRVSGERVHRSSSTIYVAIGASYFTIEDETGKLNVWYSGGCPPRMGARVTVTGKVIKPKQSTFHMFAADRVKIESSPPLGENEVRLCQLSHEEFEIHETQGLEALQEYWQRNGKPIRTVVYD